MTDTEHYALGLLIEEMGEALQLAGKALRFGLDSPGVKDPLTGVVDVTVTPRTRLALELGDVLAAIQYAEARGLIDSGALYHQHHNKLNKLLDPEAKDNLGRRLAP